MKKIIAAALFSTIGFVSFHAQAFITVIDVTEKNGEVTTISNGTEYKFNELAGKAISYRGQASEAVKLFTSLADAELPKGLYEVDTEINAATETVAIIIRVQGFAGSDYSSWILKKVGN